MILVSIMKYVKANGTNTDQKWIMDFVNFALKMTSLKNQELKLINTEIKFMIAKLMVVRRI